MPIREMLFSALYNYVSRVDREGEIKLMNFGYLDDGSAQSGVDCSSNLYLRATRDFDLSGKRVLEVGCGRGGGLALLHSKVRPLLSHGVDPSAAAIQFCSDHYQLEGLTFSVGTAEGLQFSDETFDCVINVESSHRYQGFGDFVTHTFRVLRPGGLMMITDFRYDHEVTDTRNVFKAAGFEIVRQDDITEQVVRALIVDDARRRALVDKHVPWPLGGIARNFAGTVGSATFKAFQSRKYVYFSDVYRKPS
ncbi:MAG: class I SAM-dependent methyltransferase [Rhizobiaceae bacterium]|nr:class I SAM-dependent methyltransferase [Rhizobiaceae bacterium]